MVVVVFAVVGDAVVMGDVVIITMMMSLLTAVRGPSPCAVQSARGATPGHLQQVVHCDDDIPYHIPALKTQELLQLANWPKPNGS